jgi:hypothetical protein
MLCHSVKWRHYDPLKSMELLTQWQSITSLVTWIVMVVSFKNVFLCSHISHFTTSGYTFNRFSIQRRGKILEVFELPIFIEVGHLNKILIQEHFMNKSIICLKVSHFPGTYELCWSSCSRSWAPHMCCLHIYSVWKVHVKWKCGQISKCVVSLNFCVWSVSHRKCMEDVNVMGTAMVQCFFIMKGQLMLLKTGSRSVCPGMSTVDDCHVQMSLSEGTDALRWLTVWEANLSLCSAHIAHDLLRCRKMCACWVPKILTNNHKSHCTSVTHAHATWCCWRAGTAVHFHTGRNKF